jgi:S1-C subfamily serine protease
MRRIGVLISGTVAGLLGLLLLTTSGQTAAPSQRLNLAVVAIDATIGGDRVRASGTVVDADDGLVLTPAHAIWGATSVKVATGLGIFHGRIVARAACADLALVETQPRVPGLVELKAASDPTASGDLLTAVGRRRADPDAGASSLVTIPARAEKVGARVRLDSKLVPEVAGGPILDKDGGVVAIATGTGAAMSWDAVRGRLDQLVAGPRRLYAGWQAQYRCAGRMHAAMLRRHPRYRRADARLDASVPATRLPGTQELDR